MKKLLPAFLLILSAHFSFGQVISDMEWKKVEAKDSVALFKTFRKLVAAVEKKDAKKIKKLSLSDLDCNICVEFTDIQTDDYIVPVDTFINQSFKHFEDSPLNAAIKKNRLQPTLRITYNYHTRNLPVGYPKDLYLYELWVQTYKPDEWSKGHEGQSHAFLFVKLKSRFKFYGMTSIP